jgi:hypothetical protein
MARFSCGIRNAFESFPFFRAVYFNKFLESRIEKIKPPSHILKEYRRLEALEANAETIKENKRKAEDMPMPQINQIRNIVHKFHLKIDQFFLGPSPLR